MGYTLLLTIGSLIILLFSLGIYLKGLKRIEKIEYRQKMYLTMIGLSIVTSIGDILDVTFYTYQLTIPYYITWKIRWISSMAFYLVVYYYYLDLFNIEKHKDLKNLFISKKIISAKNIYLFFSTILYLGILFFANPPKFNEPFVYFPREYIVPISIIFTIICTVATLDIKKKYKKEKIKNKYALLSVLMIVIPASMVFALQGIVNDFAFMGICFYIMIMILYFLIENPDLLIADELVKLQKNIERSSNAKLDFLYNMSHDIRSPMNAIVELSKTLKKVEEFNETNIRNDIKSIKFSCNNLVEIVNNILDINQIASGKETLQLKEYNLNKLLADLPYVIETRIGSKPIKLEFDIDQNIASGLIGDTTKIYRVLMNILTNSVKYTEVGKIRMTIQGHIEGDTQHLSIKISDTGYGIKKDDFDKMFTKFNRLDDATDNSIEGTGLGLVITKKYVDSMDGKIWFESEYGAGTIFFIELPQKIVNATPLARVSDLTDNKKVEIVDCSNNKVLIVDDNTLNIKVTKKILEKYNITVESVKTGEDCIFKIKSGEEYDMILLDDVLPDITGIEVVDAIKSMEGYKIPPIVAYTANVMNGIKEEYLKHGFDEYMPKPFDIYQFDEIVKRYCIKK